VKYMVSSRKMYNLAEKNIIYIYIYINIK